MLVAALVVFGWFDLWLEVFFTAASLVFFMASFLVDVFVLVEYYNAAGELCW